MPINQVQFQQGLSLVEFLDRYGSEDKCERAVVDARWPHGFVCPACSSMRAFSFRRGGLLYWECRDCKHQCSLISGAIYESTKLKLTQWFVAMHFLTQSKNNVSALELKRHIGVCYKTALLLKHKVMEVMRLREASRQLTGRVEVDDAHLGGERQGGKVGRGSENKVPLIAAVQTTESGNPVLCCFKQCPFTTQAVRDFVATSLALPATVVSDGLGCFSVLRTLGILHERTVTGGGAACVKQPQFSAINTVLGNLKTSIAGTYHSFKLAKYAHRYLGEVQYRFNRRFDLHAILNRLLDATVATPPCPRKVLCLGLTEVCH